MKKENRVRIGLYVEASLVNAFRKLSEETRIPMSRLMDEAISDLLKKFGKEVEE